MLGREMTLRGMFYVWGEGPKDHLWLAAGRQVPLLPVTDSWAAASLTVAHLKRYRPSLGGSYRETPQGSVQNITSLEHSEATWSPKSPPCISQPMPQSSDTLFCWYFFLFPSLCVYNSDKGNEFLSIMVFMNLKGKKKRCDLRKIKKLT